MPDPSDHAVIAESLCASYDEQAGKIPVLVDASFQVARGRVTAVVGPSGSGKTTLLSVIGALDRPESGRLLVDGADLTEMRPGELANFRRQSIGFVFQSFNLLPTLTARENVEAGLEPLRPERGTVRKRADAALDAVGLLSLGHRFPHELSGGEQQRVAVARACVKDPPLLLADEPTGNLDEEIGAQVLDVLVGVAGGGEDGTQRTLIVVTHDAIVAERADETLVLRGHQVHRT